jgi:DNA-binding transcriptional MerR regulator
MEKKSDSHLFTVLSVAKTCGVSPHTIRAWEKRYQCVEPIRLENGRRMYNREQAEYLQALAQLTRQGHSIKKLTEIPKEEISNFLENNQNLKFQKSNTPIEKISDYQSGIITALKAYDLDQIGDLLNRSRIEMGLKEYILEIAFPLLSHVGNLVAENKLKIAQEHALSAILRDQLSQISFSNAYKNSSVALTTPEGNHHEFGIFISSILCKIHGVKPRYLGTNLPAESLIQAMYALKLDTVIIGATPVPKELMIVSLDKYLKEIDRLSTRKIKILLGGEMPSKMKYEYIDLVYLYNLQELDQRLTEMD